MKVFETNPLITLPGAAFLSLRQHMVSLIFQTAITGGCIRAYRDTFVFYATD